ncbi:MAG: RNase adapter protein RapZ [Frankiaceae bacterium]|nr:RNase adapter protein RapZ [Frankiaceae bacterium]MDQ1725631.1 RNase adapter protein RapZ [Frankiaceae bacterium]
MTAATPHPAVVPPLELVLITGLAGAGRSTAADVLEDLGWFVVDNLPPSLLPTMAQLAVRSQGAVNRVAAVIDARSGSFFAALREGMDALEEAGISPRIVFLEASDDVLIRRFENVRRPHPLQGNDRLPDGIARERVLLSDLRGAADLVIDTSTLNVHELRAKVDSAFAVSGQGPRALRANVVSFGYKHGLPVDADLVVDCRFLPNPHWVPELRPRTGLDPEVRDYVLSRPGAADFLDEYTAVLRTIAQGYVNEGKRYVTLAVGCTGGKHRSVAMSEELAARLRELGADVTVSHRDLGRE